MRLTVIISESYQQFVFINCQSPWKDAAACSMLHAVSISPQFLSSVTILLWLLFFAANNWPVFVPVTGRLLVPCDLKEKCVGSSKDP